MPVFKDEKRGTWYVMVRYRDWTGERKQKCKRGFSTKREAQDWEANSEIKRTIIAQNGGILVSDDACQCLSLTYS